VPSSSALQSLEVAIDAELRRHGSVAAGNVFASVCSGGLSGPALSGPDRDSAARIENALEGLTVTRSLFDAFTRLGLPHSVAGTSELARSLDGEDALLDRARLCRAFAAGENPLRLVWLEEEPRRRVEEVSATLDAVLRGPETVPQPLLLVEATLRQVDAAARIQRLRVTAARAER
jgi:hypothetical protein